MGEFIKTLAELLQQRANARAEINKLEGEIEGLKEEVDEEIF